jgi:ribosomal protein S18 acetylase RimI-like enzyme
MPELSATSQAAFQAAAKERRCSSASLYVAHDNVPALALYKASGFQVAVGGLFNRPCLLTYVTSALLPTSPQHPIVLASQESATLTDYYSPGSHASKMVAESDCPRFQAFLSDCSHKCQDVSG